MSGTIHLIVEGQNDADIVKAILRKKYPNVRVSPLYPHGNPNIAQLAKQIDELIQQAIKKRQPGDCIAVLHDLDMQTKPDKRENYNRIKQVCKNYEQHVKLINAVDEIESWLMADTGFCKWLGIKAKNCDEEKQPSERLKSLFKKNNVVYRVKNLSRILDSKLEGDGDQHSPSLREALAHLHNAPCTKT